MKAIQFKQHGTADVLKLEALPKPRIKANEVLVEIKAAALNHLDLWIRRGLPGLEIPLPHIPGSDASGIIRELGEKVSGWSVGEAVVIQPGRFCGLCPACQQGRENMCLTYGILGETEAGLQREFVALDPVQLGRKPKNLSFTEAAALPLAALTAWNMLKNRAQLQSGETLLVLGAGSGVGTMALQLGKHLGAQVLATAGSPEKQALALSLGADAVLDHHQTGFYREVKALTAGRGVDVVFEHVGEATCEDSLKSLAFGGRLVSCGASTGVNARINLRHLFYKRLSILGSTMGSVSDFQDCLDLAEQGLLRPVLDRIFPFSEIQAAHRYLEFQHHFGKVVLSSWA